ncbi:MAG: sugar transferase [Flavobacteriales bacterium]|jgi:lipopolysaccharide/colanic/teichoic acid biosynthesis glycosyltransferase
MKRLMDLFTALLVLVLFLPFGILISLLILLESSGGVFYRQERIGLKGKPFYLLKFRSMRPNADLQGKLTVGERDPRVTRIGFFIRKFKLDEFPQFINVLKGEMSVVGPRPEVAEYVALYSDIQRRVLDVKPGITDEASITYFEENKLLSKSTNPQKTYIEEIMPEKIRINLAYQERATVWTDLGVVWKTAARMVK